MKSRNHGFTIIEVLTVVAIAAVLLAIAVPSFVEQFARRRLEGAANELSADLQYARTQAVSNNPAAGTSASVSLVTTSSGTQYTVSSSTTTYKTVALDPQVSVTPSITITYDALRGMANDTSGTPIILSSTKTTAQLQVSTNAMGRVLLCTPSGTFKGYATC